MNRTETIAISMILSLVILSIFFFLFTFERKVDVYSTINPGRDQLNKDKTLIVGQSFEKIGFCRFRVLIKLWRRFITREKIVLPANSG